MIKLTYAMPILKAIAKKYGLSLNRAADYHKAVIFYHQEYKYKDN
jgi:hypothetical protein